MRRASLVLAVLTALAAQAEQQVPNAGVSPELRAPGGLMDASPKSRLPMLSVFLGFPGWWSGWDSGQLGLSGRFTLPLLHDGLVPSINDSISLDVGVDIAFLTRRSFATLLDFPVELMWALHMTPSVAAYLKLGLALELAFGNYCYVNGVCNSNFGLNAVGAAGITVALKPNLILRVEAGYPWLKVGVGIPF